LIAHQRGPGCRAWSFCYHFSIWREVFRAPSQRVKGLAPGRVAPRRRGGQGGGLGEGRRPYEEGVSVASSRWGTGGRRSPAAEPAGASAGTEGKAAGVKRNEPGRSLSGSRGPRDRGARRSHEAPATIAHTARGVPDRRALRIVTWPRRSKRPKRAR